MANVVTQLARYMMILLILLYTYYNFRYFSLYWQEDRSYVCGNQVKCMFLILILADTVIWLRTEDVLTLAFCLVQMAFLAGYLAASMAIYPGISRILLNNICMLMAVSFIMLTRISSERAMRQFVIVLASAVLSLLIPALIGRVWQLAEIPWVYGIGGILLLAAVAVVGQAAFGAQLSLRIGGFSFQPSEFVKLSFVFFVAAMFYRAKDFRTIVRSAVAAALHVLVLVASKDLGSALIFFTAYLLMLFVAVNGWQYLIAGIAAGCLAAVLAYHLFHHVQIRVEAWQNPFADISGNGYQIAQGLFAIGTGGWFGMGLYQGMPEKIPVVTKDFIFAAISEEFGGIFGICIILICLGCFLQFMRLARRMEAGFYRLVAFGLGVIYIVQVFLTIGGVTKFIPSTGVTLPFVSYGGSSVLSSFLMFAVIQGIYILKADDDDWKPEPAGAGTQQEMEESDIEDL
ncbi:FtsW/RodA/SpoVE family cell cycle protein [Clostridium vitabionis]|uniref:FtsW/RodA/SpoVE family cell cycle protein n=1 Tax=Clostridium vitabionis TaxID=2784388 RepID=UPI00188D3DD7|nr:FtsW/RodA/SpoVE family cell cycle protein [Clostridium vitabionis]